MRALLLVPVVACVLLTGACSSTPTADHTTRVVAVGNDQTKTASPAATKPDKQATSDNTATSSTKTHSDTSASTQISAGVHTVLLRSYNTAKHTAVIEPVTLGTGAAFCAARHVATQDCLPDLVIVPSGKTYTLAVDPGVRTFTTQGGNPECLQKAQNTLTIPGDCLDGGAESLSKQVKQNPDGWLVQVANTNQFIYEISELYRP